MKKYLLFIAFLPIFAQAQNCDNPVNGGYAPNCFDVYEWQFGELVPICVHTVNSQLNDSLAAIRATFTGLGSGTVTSVTSGSLSPLFTSSVATGTTTPAISYTLTAAGARTVLCNTTNGSAAPAYSKIDIANMVFGSLAVANGGTGTTLTTSINTTPIVFGSDNTIAGGVTTVNVTSPITSTGGASPTIAVIYSTTPTASTLASWDSHKALYGNAFNTTTGTNITAAATITLTVDSFTQHVATGSTNVFVYKLPATTTVPLGYTESFVNKSSVTINVKGASGAPSFGIVAGTILIVRCIANTGASGIGEWSQDIPASISGLTASGDLVGTYPSPSLVATGTVGTYSSVTTDAQGRVTSGTAGSVIIGAGTATLASGTVTVSNASVLSTDKIIISGNTASESISASVGYWAPVASITNNTSFVINAYTASSIVVSGAVNANDNSTINWIIVR